MKTHVRNTAVGGVLVPVALALATLIANEAQTLIGLHLDNVALSIYLLPFLLGATAAVVALLRNEAAKIGGELGKALGELAGAFGGLAGEAPAEPSAPPVPASQTPPVPLPPPPPAP